MKIFKVIWNNQEVGQLINPIPDMWYLEGDWKPNETSDSVRFIEILKSLNASEVMKDLSKGLQIILKGTGADDLEATVISFDSEKLFVRRKP